MSPARTPTTTAAARYDEALRYGRVQRLPATAPRPQPTAAWPAENSALLERYQHWLLSGGASPPVVRILYIPMAGHVLGLNLKPHTQLDLDADLAKATAYIQAKQPSAEWTKLCRNALAKFRRFLRHERGLVESKVQPYVAEPHTAGLPDWLVRELTRYQHLRQANWRPARLEENIRTFWSHQLRLWRWLCEQYRVVAVTDVKRQYVLAYLDQRLAAGYTAKSVNQDLRAFQAFLRFLQENEYPVPQVLFRLRGLPEPDSLPRFLTDVEVRLLSADLAQRVQQATLPHQRRDALLDRAAFYLMWQGGLRIGEVEELRLDDLNLAARQLTVRRGKGQHDRTVYLADSAVQALQAYLAVRGPGPTDHVFLYRNQPVCKELLRGRIKAAGARTGVKVYPHRLRHPTAQRRLPDYLDPEAPRSPPPRLHHDLRPRP
jgi:site-specific recombinase XerD